MNDLDMDVVVKVGEFMLVSCFLFGFCLMFDDSHG